MKGDLIISVFSITVWRAVIIAAIFAVTCNPLRGAEATGEEMGSIHFLIPGGAGGGWDTTARAVGGALLQAKLVGHVSYENLSGGGGGVAIAHLIETAPHQATTLMVGSTALVARSINGVLPQGFSDLTPIASVVADYSAIVVHARSPIENYAQFLQVMQGNPKALKIAGGSVRGGLDHLVAELAMMSSGIEPGSVSYVPYDGGGQARSSLLSGETDVLSTGVSEIIAAHKQGQMRILAVTAPGRLTELPQIPTLSELGYDTVFANWRGFFGPPGLPDEAVKRYQAQFELMKETEEWNKHRSRLALINFFQAGEVFKDFLRFNEEQIRRLNDSLRTKH